jgi:sugar phosphate isomerase/epimerase
MQSRRKFLAQSLTATAIPLLGMTETLHQYSSDDFSTPISVPLYIFATNWGFNGDLASFCQKAKAAGYDGIEMWVPGNATQRDLLLNTVAQFDLKLGLLTGSGKSNFEEHRNEFRQQIDLAMAMKPVYINCHSGKDFFTISQAKDIITDTILPAKQSGIPIYHETHRGRICYNIPTTQALLSDLPEMKLTLDISHWCVVHESLLKDQKESVDLALTKTGHIHARVGHQEGPQVTDPRAPEWQDAFMAHLAWWDEIVKLKNQKGEPITILTEFGPPMYLPVVPYTQQPLANQWDINVYMLNFLRNRYQNK